uniref:TonB-dependent receptor plug domain-containing protein n=1 Tax=Natronospira sp. TaxID=2024970 RepID=UPI003872EBB4
MTHPFSLKRAVQAALAMGVTASLTAPVAVAQEEEEGMRELDRVQVTGSRITRTQVEGATPMMTIDREDMEATNFQTVADVVRNLSFNSFGSFRETSGNTSQSQATLSLRGIGANRTLVLLNGRRVPGSPVINAASQNLNTIPFAAVERIEVLSDGASAVYGSDAIGGVVNVILRDDFEGAEITLRDTYPERDGDGGKEQQATIVGGIAGDRGNVTFSLEKDSREILFARDRFWLSSRDMNPEGQFGFEDTFGFSHFARNVDRGNGYESMIEVGPGEDDCAVYGDGFQNPAFVRAGNPICAYDHTQIAAETASLDRTSVFMDANYEITPDVSFWARGMHTTVESFGRYAPAAGQFVWAGDTLDEETITHDGQDVTLKEINPGDVIGYRFDNTGPGRDTTQSNYVTDLQFGFEGFMPEFLGGFDWEVGYQHNVYDAMDWGVGYVNVLGLNEAAEQGWDPRHPDQDQFEHLVAGMRENASRQIQAKYDRFDFGGQFDGPMLAAGPMSFFVGGEYFEQRYNDETQAQAEAGNILGTAGGSSGGSRDVWALFAETVMPLHEDVELDFALRRDDYSDFGDNLSAKAGIRWQPQPWFLVRGSYSEGFRAPTLDQLFQAPAQSFAFAVDIEGCLDDPGRADDVAGCVQETDQQHETFIAANPDLDAETSEQISVGAVFDFEPL